MRNRAIAIVTTLLVVVGCAKDRSPDVGKLPSSKYACRIVDRSPLEIPVRVTRPDGYLVGELDMNGSKLASLFTNAVAQWGKGIPVAIRAEPETRFGVVWQVVRLASTNGCVPVFDVRVPDVGWPRRLAFHDAETVLATTGALNTVSVACRKEGIRLDAEVVSLERLQQTFRSLASITPGVTVLIVVSSDVSHQVVVNILDACEGAGMRQRILGIEERQ